MDKLIVKLRIPEAGDELRFDCPICQKSFSSGKGLGGHKRVHLLTPPQNSKSTDHRSSELQTSKEAENSAERNHPCPICQQAFASEKSVHGHMRKHPDRNWRGMRPPAPQVEVEVENDDPLPLVSGAVPLLEGSNWSTDHQSGTDKLEAAAERRRRHGKPPMEIIPDKESISVAYDLMALANGEPHPKQDFEPKKLKLMELGNSGPVALGAGSIIRGENSLFVHKKPIRAQKIYVCDICNRPFRTYQALGGHKSHHVLNVRGDDKSAAADRRAPPPPPVNKVPSCPEADKENDNQCTVFGFDLNEPPPEETGPGGDGAGC